MAQYFSGASGLAEAINAATNYDVSIAIANDIIQDAYLSAGTAGVKQVAAEYGINAFGTQAAVNNAVPLYWQVGAMEGLTPATAETLYPAVLDCSIDTVNNEVVFETAKQVTTQGGSKIFNAGAIKTATTALNVVGAIATGAQLGWDSYKEHPDFWTDLSESIFNSSDPNTPVEVLARAHSGGYTTAVKEKEVCNILQKMAEQGCFDYSIAESTVEHTGIQDITITPMSAFDTATSMAASRAASLYPGEVIYQVISNPNTGNPNVVQGIVYCVNPANIPSQLNISKNTTDFTTDVYTAILSGHGVVANYNTQTHETTYYNTSGNYVTSGYVTRNSGQIEHGGLNVHIEEGEATNQLFTNDHSPTNLSIAPSFGLNQISEAIRNHFPDWFNDSWTQPEYDPETNTISNERYYPITIPWWDPTIDTTKDPNFNTNEAQKGDIKPDSDPQSKPQGENITKNNPKYETDPALKPTVPVPSPTPTPDDPGAGAGGSASGLWAVYNPTISELNDLGAYLWTNNIVELLEKFLQNPMDAIISLHRLYATPTTGAAQHIILGYLDSGVSADVVTNQFTSINCGTVNVPEYFEDARDYDAPYTLVEAYLPFIGIVRLRTEDIIGGAVNIVYEVDVYSGACLCKVFVTKLGAKQLLYTYSGNCSMQIPLTGGDRTRLLSGALTGAVAGAAVGGPVGAVAGAVGGAFKGGASIDRCGGFSANAACMGIKKPYLIITRKYAYDAGSYNEFYGYPSNVTVSLASCRGYTQVKSVHIETIPVATDNEKTEIESLLKQGVIIR